MDVWVMVLVLGIERARFEFKGEASRMQEGVRCAMLYDTMVMLGRGGRGGVLVVMRVIMLMLRW